LPLFGIFSQPHFNPCRTPPYSSIQFGSARILSRTSDRRFPAVFFCLNPKLCYKYSGLSRRKMNQTPEQISRDLIDRRLTDCGSFVQRKKKINLGESLGVAVREFQTDVGLRLGGIRLASEKFSYGNFQS
jgi:hypothetical protein